MPEHFYPNTERRIQCGDTVLRTNDPSIGGIVYNLDEKFVYVAWVKWDPAIEAAMTDWIPPNQLVYKGRN